MLRAPVANIVLLVEEEVRVVVARVALAGRDSDRVKVDAIGLRSLQDGDVLEKGFPETRGSITLRSIALLASIWFAFDQPPTRSPAFS